MLNSEITEDKVIEALITLGKISQADADKALQLRAQAGQRLWRVLIDLGLVSEEDIRLVLSEMLSLPIWERKRQDSYPVLEEMPSNFLLANKVLPLKLENNTLHIAIADPMDTSLLETIRYTTGKGLKVYLGCEKDIFQALQDLYKSDTQEGAEDASTVSLMEVTEDIERLKDLASEAPVIRFVNDVLNKAIEGKASDVHLEITERETKLRYRIDGLLRDFNPPLRDLYPAIISRVKILSKLNIAEKRLPQDGRIKLKVAGKQIDLRVSIIPTIQGEGVVLRILDRSAVCLELDKLGFSKDVLKKLRQLIKKPEGMILVTGPTGSGKTTTLYSALKEIQSPELKIVTIEDPVEYSLPGINQIQVNPQIELTFAKGLRHILRHDPDIILIGEIRDRETASIAIQSALTGHLVLSTLHTNDAASAFTRLLDMGMEDYLVTSCVVGVMAQRLLRILCPHCKEAYAPEESVLTMLGRPSRPVYRPKGCEECNHTGYQGRFSIGELLLVDDTIRKLVIAHSTSTEIAKAARASGTKSLWEDGLENVLSGHTSLDELLRVAEQEPPVDTKIT